MTNRHPDEEAPRTDPSNSEVVAHASAVVLGGAQTGLRAQAYDCGDVPSCLPRTRPSRPSKARS